MATIYKIAAGPGELGSPSFVLPVDEGVGGMLFDTSDFDSPFEGKWKLLESFGAGQCREIWDMAEVGALGLADPDFMGGLPLYHLERFYGYAGGRRRLYVCFADCSSGWEAVGSMQLQAGGALFQVGVWTARRLWEEGGGGVWKFSSLAGELEEAADQVNGRPGEPSWSATPLSLLLFPGTEGPSRLSELPSAAGLGCPKVSAFLAQDGGDAAMRVKERLPQGAWPGEMGLVLGALSECGAEESLASPLAADLNRAEQMRRPMLCACGGVPVSDVHETLSDELSSKGYVAPVLREGLEGGVFLSCDKTLGSGALSLISNNRLIHKCRRAACAAPLRMLNGSFLQTPEGLAASSGIRSALAAEVAAALDSVLRNRAGQPQARERSVAFEEGADGSFGLRISIVPAGRPEAVTETIDARF